MKARRKSLSIPSWARSSCTSKKSRGCGRSSAAEATAPSRAPETRQGRGLTIIIVYSSYHVVARDRVGRIHSRAVPQPGSLFMPFAERTSRGRPPPGRGGNPTGRPPARNNGAVVVETVLEASAGPLAEALVGAASAGNARALRICFDRLAPPRNGRPVRFALPLLVSDGDAVDTAGKVLRGNGARRADAAGGPKPLQGARRVPAAAGVGGAVGADAVGRGRGVRDASGIGTCTHPRISRIRRWEGRRRRQSRWGAKPGGRRWRTPGRGRAHRPPSRTRTSLQKPAEDPDLQVGRGRNGWRQRRPGPAAGPRPRPRHHRTRGSPGFAGGAGGEGDLHGGAPNQAAADGAHLAVGGPTGPLRHLHQAAGTCK
jgi:hypothetical protein